MFKGRKLVIATKHHKESVIAPIFEKEIGVITFVPSSFDTDQLGTFSGEIKRTEDAFATVAKKAKWALELTNETLVVANEGSFGPHPHVFMANADFEIVYFLDVKNNLEIIATELSLDTNFGAITATSWGEVKEFALRAQFPSHALLIRKEENNYEQVWKGITSWETLEQIFYEVKKDQDKVYLETDMRALYNPTRMKVIENATRKLISKIKKTCPSCDTPGFDIVQHKEGLPCKWCGSPTQGTLSVVYQCKKCQFSQEQLYPNDKRVEDPMYCDYCNP